MGSTIFHQSVTIEREFGTIPVMVSFSIFPELPSLELKDKPEPSFVTIHKVTSTSLTKENPLTIEELKSLETILLYQETN